MYSNPPLIPTNTDPAGIAIGDFNKDGKADIVYVDGGVNFSGPPIHTLHILLGRGNGAFSHSQDIVLPPGVCCAITIADVTGDGIPDIVMQGSEQFVVSVAVMVGNGNGTFQTPIVTSFQPPSISGYPGFVASVVGDLNDDGKMDLVLPDIANGELYILYGDGSGAFSYSSSVLTYTDGSVYLADLNGDNNLDIIATDPIGANFLVFLGNGDGTFQTRTNYTVGMSAGPFILVDIDGDGHLDILTEYYPENIGYFKGNPDGTFQPLATIGSVGTSDELVGVADFNADKIPDLAFSTPTGVGIELGKGNLAYGSIAQSVSGHVLNLYSVATTTVAADFNNDGFTDLGVAVEGGIVILLGNGDGTFASAPYYDMGQQAGAVAIADFNGDGNPDIAVTQPAIYPQMLLGNGKGEFTPGPNQNTSYNSQYFTTNIFAADFNGDGKMDVDFGTVALNVQSAGTQSIAFGIGNGTFRTPMQITNASPVIADFNADGRADMLSISGNTVTVLLGNANQTFSTVTTTLRDGYTLFGVGDVNNDGKPDLVLNYTDHLEIWLGNADGSFTYSSSIENQVYGYYVVAAVADVDGDGNADIVLMAQPDATVTLNILGILYGNGDGTFGAPVSVPVAHQYIQLVVADVNLDGKPDLVLTDGNVIALMLNEGGRKFESEQYYVGGQTVSWLSVADVNGDGYPDIAVANPNGTTVVVLLYEPTGTSLEGKTPNGTLTISPEPSAYAHPFTISMAVAGASGGAAPTGTVDFSIDGGIYGSAPVTNGSASYTVKATLIPTEHTVVTTYNGDSTYGPLNLSSLHAITPPTYSTSTVLAATPLILLASQTVHLTATVTSNPPIPEGFVTFLDGTNSLGFAEVNAAGIAYLDTALLSVGTHALSANYDGFTQTGFTGSDATYTAAIFAASASPAVAVVVDSDATATRLSTSNASPTSGTVVTLTAAVSSSAGTPFGGATFYDGNSLLGTSSLTAAGTGTFSTASLSTGMHKITAGYNANGPFAGSTSSPVTITVVAASDTAVPAVVSLAPEISTSNSSARLTAVVSSPMASPAGVVTFLDNGLIVGNADTGPSGIATLNIAELASGIHNFSASFGGASGFAPAVSPQFEDQWPPTGPGFSLNLAANRIQVAPSGSSSLRISVVPAANFAQPVQLACANGIPQGYSCTFSPSVLNGVWNSTLTIEKSPKTNAIPSATIFALAMTLGIVCIGVAGRPRRQVSKLRLLFACCGLAALMGCSTVPISPPLDEFVVTIRATSGVGTGMIVHCTQVAVVTSVGE